jgi:hypothetical protein
VVSGGSKGIVCISPIPIIVLVIKLLAASTEPVTVPVPGMIYG